MFLKDGNIPDPIFMENSQFKIFQTIIKRQLEGGETDKWNKIVNTCMGVSEETSTRVRHMCTMEKTGTNHQKRERTRTEVMGAKSYKPTSFVLILLLFPSLIFTVIEVPTPIFVLSRFASYILFILVPTGKLLVDLGGGSN